MTGHSVLRTEYSVPSGSGDTGLSAVASMGGSTAPQRGCLLLHPGCITQYGVEAMQHARCTTARACCERGCCGVTLWPPNQPRSLMVIVIVIVVVLWYCCLCCSINIAASFGKYGYKLDGKGVGGTGSNKEDIKASAFLVESVSHDR